MKENSSSSATDRRVSEGLYQWREDYKNQFEHFTESLHAAQEDYNKLAQQFQIAKTPFDLVLAWSAFAQCRLSHVEKAFSEAVESGVNWKSSVHKFT
jgi:hypothetical protein